MRSVHHSLTALNFLCVFDPASGVLDLLKKAETTSNPDRECSLQTSGPKVTVMDYCSSPVFNGIVLNHVCFLREVRGVRYNRRDAYNFRRIFSHGVFSRAIFCAINRIWASDFDGRDVVIEN
jgi:hypothetical protein